MEKDGKLPEFLQKVIERYPAVWNKYEEFGKAVHEAGGLDAKSRHLVKLALAVGAQREGAVHSHTRRCRAAGYTPEEIYHVGILAATTLGWPNAMAALSWINDEIKEL